MKRREFLTLVGGATAWPLAARAQQSERVRRVGALMGMEESDPLMKTRVSGLMQDLAEAGWADGRNLRLDVRFGAGNFDQLRIGARELVDLKPDVLFAYTPAATKALQTQTQAIPIIFTAVGDPVAGGLLKNIAKPEGNTTGATNFEPSFGGKWLELFKEAVPSMSRVALIFNPDVSTGTYLGPIDVAASRLAIAVTIIPYHDAADLVRGIDAFAVRASGGLVIVPTSPIAGNRALINRLAVQHRLPTIYVARDYTVEGGLMSYGPVAREGYRQSASYVDRILRGAKVADLPVQFPTKFELVVNLKTAKAMGLTIPEGFLLRADELVE